MGQKIKQYKVVFLILAVFFATFLVFPMMKIFLQTINEGGSYTFVGYKKVYADSDFREGMWNSIYISAISAVISVVIAFVLAYAQNFTNIPEKLKKVISTLAVLPMLIPTITYGFAMIYSFGKSGLITKLVGHQIINVYGMNGLVMGFVIYTMPTAFILINNTMKYIDKRFILVSRIMGDRPFRKFMNTVGIPMLGTLATAFIECFTLSFTDYGIPTSVAGNTNLAAMVLYKKMLGSLPDFMSGSVVAISMLLPSLVNVILIRILQKYNVRYADVSNVPIKKNKARDGICIAFSMIMLAMLFMVFASIFIMPFIEQWPYKINFTMQHVKDVFSNPNITGIIKNSLIFVLLTSVAGTISVYFGALLSGRDYKSKYPGRVMDALALVVNTIPGMVLGVAYLLAFKGTPLHNSLTILVICTVVHLFPTPYLMMKNTLEKMNRQWETTAALMKDSWIKTVIRIITPNAFESILEAFGYYFVNSMVTISAVVFLVSARTTLITTKIKELQHFADYDDIFVLSMLIFIINLLVKIIINIISNQHRKKKERKTI